MHSPEGYLTLEGGSRERLIKSRSDYRSARSSRNVLRVVDRLTISDSVWCMTTALGWITALFYPVHACV